MFYYLCMYYQYKDHRLDCYGTVAGTSWSLHFYHHSLLLRQQQNHQQQEQSYHSEDKPHLIVTTNNTPIKLKKHCTR